MWAHSNSTSRAIDHLLHAVRRVASLRTWQDDPLDEPIDADGLLVLRSEVILTEATRQRGLTNGTITEDDNLSITMHTAEHAPACEIVACLLGSSRGQLIAWLDASRCPTRYAHRSFAVPLACMQIPRAPRVRRPASSHLVLQLLDLLLVVRVLRCSLHRLRRCTERGRRRGHGEARWRVEWRSDGEGSSVSSSMERAWWREWNCCADEFTHKPVDRMSTSAKVPINVRTRTLHHPRSNGVVSCTLHQPGTTVNSSATRIRSTQTIRS
jgi:hypothetical protein